MIVYFEPPLKEAVLLKRYKRFLADVETPEGVRMTLHCPNTGAMSGCDTPGSRLWYSLSANPRRKYPGTWELVEVAGGHLACINTQRANTLVEEAWRDGFLPSLRAYQYLRREVVSGDSRVDFLLEGEGAPAYLEVKNLTLYLGAGLGAFPDAVTTRGQRHLAALEAQVVAGNRGVLVFCVAHSAVSRVTAAAAIDPRYAQALTRVRQAGVEVLALQLAMSPREIKPLGLLPLD